MILRSVLEDRMKSIFDPETGEARIQEDVIRAFLRTRKYKHGVRSLEAMVEMSVESRRTFHKSSLRLRDQLEMHVNAGEFLALLESPVFEMSSEYMI